MVDEKRAAKLMMDFAERTGLTSDAPQKRYLWTDAFAVCNFLGLASTAGDGKDLEVARRLVDRVHHTLGKHREDDPRTGWLSGLTGEEAEKHPTAGGLRIGKPRGERGVDEPADSRAEWDRDGQYFHYLTRWMMALDLMSRFTGEPKYNRWARELAAVAHEAFVYRPSPGASPRMYWKMSIDLSRPLVSSMGHHDPLDGYVTLRQIRQTAMDMGVLDEGPSLDAALNDFQEMVRGRDWVTTDALGLGGLLIAAARLGQLELDAFDAELFRGMLQDALFGLRKYVASDPLEAPASRRLAFRELGLAIGLAGVQEFAVNPPVDDAEKTIENLREFVPLRGRIVGFWEKDEHRESPTWTEHRDINQVMLATALAPDGCLELPEIDGEAGD